MFINVKGYAQENEVRIRWSCNHSKELPWYNMEVPTIGISLNYTNHLIDLPQLKTFINAYAPHRENIRAALEKICGLSQFTGTASDTVFCDRWGNAFVRRRTGPLPWGRYCPQCFIQSEKVVTSGLFCYYRGTKARLTIKCCVRRSGRICPPGGSEDYITGGTEPKTCAAMRSMWKRIREQVGLPDVTESQFRTTIASGLQEETHNVIQVQQLLRHSKTSTTLKHYIKPRSEIAQTARTVEAIYFHPQE